MSHLFSDLLNYNILQGYYGFYPNNKKNKLQTQAISSNVCWWELELNLQDNMLSVYQGSKPQSSVEEQTNPL